MKNFSELKDIRALTHFSDDLVEHFELERVHTGSSSYPIIGFTIGSKDPEAPCLGLFGGVHGLEKIGTHLIINYLSSLFGQLKWDKQLRELFSRCRIVSIPLVNPAGMAGFNRCNPNGVDLMRNSPVDAESDDKLFLISGQRYSNKLPWFRGIKGAPMEKESLALCNFVKEQMFSSKNSIAIDFHSGFGLKDRLWYPWSKTHDDFPNIREVQNIIDLLDETIPYHIYKIEPVSASYLIEGDLWDYLYLEKQKEKSLDKNIFIPWTMEMGSWNWVKKNPLQLFSRGGLYNPVKAHRFGRTMRRHLLLIDFFLRIVQNGQAWR